MAAAAAAAAMAKHHPDLVMCMKQPGIGACVRGAGLPGSWAAGLVYVVPALVRMPARRKRPSIHTSPSRPSPTAPPRRHQPSAASARSATASARSATRTCAPRRSCACATSATTAATRAVRHLRRAGGERRVLLQGVHAAGEGREPVPRGGGRGPARGGGGGCREGGRGIVFGRADAPPPPSPPRAARRVPPNIDHPRGSAKTE